MSRPLSKTIGLTFLVQIAIFFVVVLNNILLTRWLTPIEFGVVATFLILADGLNKGSNLGMESAILYFVSKGTPPLKSFLSTNWINSLFIYVMSITIAAFCWKTGAIEQFFEPTELTLLPPYPIALMSFLIFAAVVHEYGGNIWLGLQRFRAYNLNILSRPFLYLSILILLWAGELLTIKTVLLGYGIAWFIPGIFIWLKNLSLLSFKWRSDITKETFSYGIPMMGSRFLDFLIYRMDLLFIAFFWTQREVAIYFLAVMIVERLLYLNKATQIVLVPAVAYSEEQQTKTPLIARVNVAVVCLGGLVLALIMPYLIPLLFGEAYIEMNTPLLLLLPGIVAISLSRVISADFAARGLPGLTFRVALLNMVLNMILNLLLIPTLGIAGAAISSTTSYSIAAFFSASLYKKITGVPLYQLFRVRKKDFRALKKI